MIATLLITVTTYYLQMLLLFILANNFVMEWSLFPHQHFWQRAALPEPRGKKAEDNAKLGNISAVIHPLRSLLNFFRAG
ncbi:hypothetical protein [Pantoea sp. GbtcB22]|uniref:hypothetical protein n=1 Tax=Pantoea sp. GbtcB22 TaxID=2824767 RepID=UPI0020C5D25C|nr:hypothetical protein [Pantoea sp. GbtcB22]